MPEYPVNAEGDDFVPRRPASGDALLSSSAQVAVADVLAVIAGERHDRLRRASQAAEVIRRIGPYRWVGIYDITPEDAVVIAWSGDGPPAFVRFPVVAGLTGEAVRSRETVVSNDVLHDPRYLTSFAGTRSEIIVPVFDADGSRVVGTIDVESGNLDAFAKRDQDCLEQCAMALAPLWT
jgi:L-methionine (R)-S-oxide reductase